MPDIYDYLLKLAKFIEVDTFLYQRTMFSIAMSKTTAGSGSGGG
jgi:hypothetical protein